MTVLLRFAVLNIRAFPGRSSFLARCDSIARLLHEFREAQGQFVNPFRLPPLDRLRRNQLRSHSNRAGSGKNEIHGRLLIDAAGGDQGNFGQRRFDGLDVGVSTDLRARENF